MEKKSSTRSSRNRGMEENIMAILDASGIKEPRDIHDDKISFLEAVRAAFLVSDIGNSPSSKIYEAIFSILRDSSSPDLIMMSYQLLVALDKHFPRVKLDHVDASNSGCDKQIEIVFDEEAWAPFSLAPGSAYNEVEESLNLGIPLDSAAFSRLIENIARDFDEVNCSVPGMKLVGRMMLLQYLVNVVEWDFVCRNTVYKDTQNWSLLRDSVLNMLLGSRRISYKGLMKDCVGILAKEGYDHADVPLTKSENAKGSPRKTVDSGDVTFGRCYVELKKGTCMAFQRFFTLIMELDIIKKAADSQGQTSRSDSVRTPLLEIILDELAYDEDLFARFLQVFSDPKWKLEIIIQFFSKYLTKPAVRTRRSKDSSNSLEDRTLQGVLTCFSTDANTKGITKKINTDVVQFLLAYAFQAYLNLHHSENHGESSVMNVCRDLISTFHNLKRADKNMEMVPIGKEALFTAAAIMAMKT
ncbi:isoform X1 [Ranunculus cassubicifolius]